MAQRALGRSPEEKVKAWSQWSHLHVEDHYCCPSNIGRGPLDYVRHQI